MKILVISQYFWPENFRINDLVSEWGVRGHEVTVLTGIPNYPMGKVFDAYKKQPTEFMAFEGAKIIRAPVIARGSSRLGLALNYVSFVISSFICGAWRLRGVQADVIFVYEPSPVTVGLPAVWLGKIKKIPVVFWALDLWPDTLAAVGVVRSPTVLRWIGLLVQYIYNRCTLVLGQSRGFLGSIANYCNDASKIRYFPNWAEDIFTSVEIHPAKELTVEEDKFNIVFAGNIGEAQDIPAMLDAATFLKNNSKIRWIIVGDGRKFEWLKAEVLLRGLEHCVLLPGRFPVERMPSFYAHADALLVSLKSDPVFELTIPGKVQSYLMSGIPLLGMLDGEGAEVIRNAKAGLTCAAGDASGLAQSVVDLAAMKKSELTQLGVNGKIFAKQEFDRLNLIDKLDMFLSEAVSTYPQSFFKG